MCSTLASFVFKVKALLSHLVAFISKQIRSSLCGCMWEGRREGRGSRCVSTQASRTRPPHKSTLKRFPNPLTGVQFRAPSLCTGLDFGDGGEYDSGGTSDNGDSGSGDGGNGGNRDDDRKPGPFLGSARAFSACTSARMEGLVGARPNAHVAWGDVSVRAGAARLDASRCVKASLDSV